MDILALFGVQDRVELLWVLLGLCAQVVFGLRFIVQWWVSEKAGRSTVPVAFWYLSFFGGCLMLAYALYRWDPVFILGQGLGLAVYVRNLILIHRTGNVEGTENPVTKDQVTEEAVR